MTNGWVGKILRVDLTSGNITKEDLNEQWAHDYVGGRGLGAKYLYEELDPKVDPFSPENELIFATGPMTGTNASCGSRYMVITKSPLTGTITTSNSGGHWGPELKFAGYDMVILTGRARTPSYLWIYDDDVQLVPAEHLWGKGVWETEDTIRTETGVPDAIVSCIGPAGENRVRIAAILNDRHRAAGRNGVGAVMGSKNLKAIGVRGTGAVRVASPEGLMQATWAAKKKLKESPVTGEGLRVYGTPILVNPINEHGGLPVNNHQASQFDEAEAISGEKMTSDRLAAPKACFACTIACGRVTHLPGDAADKYMVTTHPRNWNIKGEGPEYEAAWALGADCGVGDLDALIKANWLCNDLGMDPISFGGTLAAAMELYQKGVISQKETGMPLEFGSGDALVAMAEKTAYREGFGNELAEGAKRLTEKFGQPDLFIGVKGQEVAAYDGRTFQGIGLGYATSNRGACHLKAYTIAAEVFGIPEKADPAVAEGKAGLTKLFQDLTSTVDSSGLCLFLTFGIGLDEIQPELVATTGIDYSAEDLLKIGERIYNLERMWNLKAGITGKEDTLPKRLLKEGIVAGPAKGRVSLLDQMLPEYYQARGWKTDGEPTAEKLAELGIV
ncbi:MAG: aldehyde ferredoxin oxidoreductase family protein [Dehalococcoidia bacterium]